MAMTELPPKETIRNYEAVVILHPDLTEDDQKKVFFKNKEIISQFAGEFHSLETWGKRKLANPIKKFSRGTFFHATFRSSGSAIAEMERVMRIDERVLRFSHTRLDDETSLQKHMENFHQALADTQAREKEREAKFQAKKAAAAANKRPPRPE